MHFISVNNLAALVGTSNATVQKWADTVHTLLIHIMVLKDSIWKNLTPYLK